MALRTFPRRKRIRYTNLDGSDLLYSISSSKLVLHYLLATLGFTSILIGIMIPRSARTGFLLKFRSPISIDKRETLDQLQRVAGAQ